MAAGKKVHLVQTGSGYGQKPGVKETLTGLGLGRIRQRSELQDTPSVRGMIVAGQARWTAGSPAHFQPQWMHTPSLRMQSVMGWGSA